jgi:2-polyprenyl-3-methyl-5-hydroxy-6-metoxy-1,4-benzoquinol methylase
MQIDERYKHEAEDFDQIATERYENSQRPDINGSWENTYYYNNIWRNSVFFNDEYRPMIDWVVEKLKSNNVESVIELGCGTGWLTLHLARQGLDITGCDLSQGSISIAEKYLSELPESDDLNIKYINQNIIDFDNYNGDSIVCFGFLHHLPQDVLMDRIEFFYKKNEKGSTTTYC